MNENRIHGTHVRGVTMQTLALVDIADLKWLELTCKCGASVTFDMTRDDAQFPEQCPSCKKTWNGFVSQGIVLAFQNFKNFYKVFAGTEFHPRFRVEVDSSTSAG